MKKETLQYSLPVDMGQTKLRPRHLMDFETLNGIIYRIQNKNKGKPGNG
ncbi:MAG TPA: hypothetical protein PK684_06130 [Bacillota bacterium]|jgi:hypothetical protein|nr:hypothetical protein [Bacillota bacterium]